MANVKLFSHIVVHLLRPLDDQKRDALSTFDMLATLLDSVRTFFHPSNIGTSVFQDEDVELRKLRYALFLLCLVRLYSIISLV